MRFLVNQKVIVIAGLCGLPVITWALLAWEPFDRLLAHFFPEMFTDGIGRVVGFVPYTPFDALLTTILLTVYATVPIVVILLVWGVVRSMRQKGFEKTAVTVEKGVETTAIGIVTVLSALWTAALGIAGFAARSMTSVPEDIQERNQHNDYFGGREPWEHHEYDRGDRHHHPAHTTDRFTSFH